MFTPTFDYNAGAVASALSALQSAESARLAVVSSIAAIDSGLIKSFGDSVLSVQQSPFLKAYMEDITRTSELLSTAVLPDSIITAETLLGGHMVIPASEAGKYNATDSQQKKPEDRLGDEPKS